MTLGIPRLRELFMTAAQSIKTPVMTLPIKEGLGKADATELANRLRRIRLAEVYAMQHCLQGPLEDRSLPDELSCVYAQCPVL